jgi:hypothetical protein
VNKSMLQLVMELQRRVTELEKSRLTPELLLGVVTQILDNKFLASKPLDPAKVEQNVGRAMCPKCGVKPNYFFHVKTCQGQKQKEEYGENPQRRRDPGTT